MSEEIDEIIEEKKEDIPVLEVKVVNPVKPEKVKTDYDEVDDEMYDDPKITKEEIEEFENGTTSS